MLRHLQVVDHNRSLIPADIQPSWRPLANPVIKLRASQFALIMPPATKRRDQGNIGLARKARPSSGGGPADMYNSTGYREDKVAREDGSFNRTNSDTPASGLGPSTC